MLQVVLLYVLREIVHLKTKIYKVRHKCWHFKREKTWRVFFLKVSPVQSWSLCWEQTQWHSPLWWTGCQMLPECRRGAQQPFGARCNKCTSKFDSNLRASWYDLYYKLCTLLPSGLSTTKTSLQIWIPVVSLSQPPLQVNPVRGSSSPPIHESLCSRREERGERERVRWEECERGEEMKKSTWIDRKDEGKVWGGETERRWEGGVKKEVNELRSTSMWLMLAPGGKTHFSRGAVF